MEPSEKSTKELWEKVRAVMVHKKAPREPIAPLQQDFFPKAEVIDNGKVFTIYYAPGSETKAPLLKIKKLKQTLAKDELLKSCKNPVDFTGSISMHSKNGLRNKKQNRDMAM